MELNNSGHGGQGHSGQGHGGQGHGGQGHGGQGHNEHAGPHRLNDTLRLQLKTLRLSGVLETLEVRHQQAITGQWSYVEFLNRLLEDEVERRAQSHLAKRLHKGAINSSKTLEEFSFSFNPNINRQQVLALAAGDYLRSKRNVFICGPSGVGKTHLAQALGHQACRQGYDVLFLSTHKMLAHLHGGRADNSLERRLASYLRPHLLILDDFGLRPLQQHGAEDLYDIINERYEKGSILLTSNRSPREWPALFNDPLIASAGLDRLADRAEMLVIRGQSYRAHGRGPYGRGPLCQGQLQSLPDSAPEPVVPEPVVPEPVVPELFASEPSLETAADEVLAPLPHIKTTDKKLSRDPERDKEAS